MTGENQIESLDSHETVALRRRIAELEQQVAEHHRSEELCQILIQHSLQGLAVIQEDRIVFANLQLATLTGYTLPELSNMTVEEVFNLVHPEDRDRVTQWWQARAAGSFPVQPYQMRIIRKDGVPRWFEILANNLEYQGQSAVQMGVIDITDRIVVEQALRESEAKFRGVIEESLDGFVLVDAQGTVVEWNRGIEVITGLPREAVVGRPLWDIQFSLGLEEEARLPGAYDSIRETVLRTINQDSSPWLNRLVEHEIQRPDGERRIVQTRIFPVTAGGKRWSCSVMRDVSERRRSEQQLQQSEARYRSLFEDSPVALWEEDFSGVKQRLDALRAAGVSDFQAYFEEHPEEVQYCGSLIGVLAVNQATLDLFKAHTQEDLPVDRGVIPGGDFFSPELVKVFRDEFIAFAGGQLRFEGEAPVYFAPGQWFHALLTISIAPGYEQTWGKVIVSTIDVSAHKQAEEQFRYRAALLSQLSDAVISTDLNFIIRDWNLAAEAIYGWRADEVIGKHINTIVSTEVPGAPLENLAAQLLKEGTWRGEAIQKRKDGTTLNVLSSVSFLRDEAGGPVAVIAVNRDITDRKRIEQAEREQQTLAEALRDSASLLTGTLNLDEVLERILSHMERVVPHDSVTVVLIDQGKARLVRGQGYAVQELEAWVKAFKGDVTEMTNWRQMIETGLPLVIPDTHDSPYWIVLEKREWIHSYAGAPIRVGGQVVGFLNLVSRTSGFFKPECAVPLMVFADQAAVAIKNAQLYNEVQSYAVELQARVDERTAQFKQAKEHVETILNSSSDVIILLSSEGKIQQVNPSFNETFNCVPDECTGQPVTVIAAPDSAAPLMAALHAAVEQKRPQRLAIEVCYNADVIFDADVTLSPIVQTDGLLSGVVCSLHDITMLKQTEASLRRMLTREMELGELKSRFITTTSHEFRTPMTIIQTSTDVLMRYADRLTLEQKQEEYHRIRTSITTMVALLDDILVISRAERGKLEFAPEPLDVEAFCQEALAVVEMTSGRDHTLVFSYSGSHSPVLLDPKLLRHMINNLLSNAIKYSQPRTTVTFEVACENNRVTLRVKDEGIGIPLADQIRLFEPFYRAQNASAITGTGLGLAIVKQSVDLHRGTIVVESSEGNGSTFMVTLPAVFAGANSS